ncbi:peroxidase family protein [Cupriavidus basilensis]|uniref:Peroxidase family protein n=1 Tax=Cupriavidus basilensis TaxID=68895 RepID=A0ABT6AQ25_9BURK|nr:peroxidase family protein [Cupriavidus basilensis]MDF3834712.1 peroxidase family protein [Cupriavidus basilensis]
MSLFDEVLGGIGHIPFLGDQLNRIAINHIATRTTSRPRPFSLWSPDPSPPSPAIGSVSEYTSWPGLTDRRFSGRHLPVASPEYLAKLQTPVESLIPLFKRSSPMKEDRSSVLFMFFAQWFTDSVLRVDPTDRRRNTSNHDIDLCQIYGLSEATASILRSHEGGRLRCRDIDGESFLDYLYVQGDPDSPLTPKPEYAGLPYIEILDSIFQNDERRRKAYATGLERGNSTIGYVAISTIFMREHNRICAGLAASNPGWGDERLFQTARMINIVLLMKVVVEDYINHIAGNNIFKLDPNFAEDQSWYRTNWIAIEFDLLYRWHSLVPDAIQVAGQTVVAGDFRNNNELLEHVGIAQVLTSASNQRAGRIGLFNSPSFLLQAETASLTMSRAFKLQSYNDYREQFGLNRLSKFSDLTKDDTAIASIKQCYGSIDDVEFLVGIMAEDRTGGALFGDLLNTMVAYDAFTQIFTNPLLSRNVFGPQTFSEYGMDVIESTRSIRDIAKRNIVGDVTANLGA